MSSPSTEISSAHKLAYRPEGKEEKEKKEEVSELTLQQSELGLDIPSGLGVVSSNLHDIFKPTLVGRGDHDPSALKRFIHGDAYQLKVLMLFLWRGFKAKYSFYLATEMEQAGKFDDLFFQYVSAIEPGKVWYRYLQAKHKMSGGAIRYSDLFKVDDKNPFGLCKYFVSYQRIKKKFTDGIIKDLIICTNVNFDFAPESVFEPIKLDEIFNFDKKKSGFMYRFKVKEDFDRKEDLYVMLQQSSDMLRLAKKLADDICSKKKLTLKNDLYKMYHAVLSEKVLDITSHKFRSKFLSHQTILEIEVTKFREVLINEIAKRKNFDTREDVLRFLDGINFIASKGFGLPTEDTKGFPDDYVTRQDIDEFLTLLTFAVNQPNEKELSPIIAKEIGEQFNLMGGSGFIASQFQCEMFDWMKEKRGSFLSHEEGEKFFARAKQKIDKLILSGPMIEYRNMLKNFKLLFKSGSYPNLIAFLDSDKQVFNIIALQSTQLTSIIVSQTCNELALNGRRECQDGNFIFIRLESGLNISERLISAFEDENSRLLIIECDTRLQSKNVHELLKNFYEILLSKKKKLILITSKSNPLGSPFKEHNKYVEQQDLVTGFNNLDVSSQELIKNKNVMVQGSAHPLRICLNDSELASFVSPEVLLEMLKDEIPIVGDPVRCLSNFELACYIERKLNRNVFVKREVLEENDSDIFVMIGSLEVLNKLIPKNEKWIHFKSLDSSMDLEKPHRYILLSEEGPFKEPQEISFHESYSKNNIHYLCLDGENLIWKKTIGSVEGLRSYILENNVQFEPTNIDDKLVIIAGEPGMGKSTLITKLAGQFKEKNPHCLVIRIDLNSQKEYLATVKDMNEECIIYFLTQSLKLTNSFAIEFFKIYFKKTGTITLFLDGFDEISTALQEIIIQLLRVMKNTFYGKVFITTRIDKKIELENKLGIFSYAINCFSDDDKIKYLNTFWVTSLGLSHTVTDRQILYTKELLKLFAASIRDRDLKFIGVPLLARLLAEAFLFDYEKFCSFTELNTNLPRTLDLFELYQRFINRKYEVYFKEKITIEKALSYGLRVSLEKSLTKKHQHIALRYLFPEEALKFLSQHSDKTFSNEELSMVGIIQFENGKLEFVHRTFAEYFTATLVVNYLKKLKNHRYSLEIKKFILMHIFKERTQVIRSFVEQQVIREKDVNLTKEWQAILKCSLLFENPSLLSSLRSVRLTLDRKIEKVRTKPSSIVENLKQCEELCANEKYSGIYHYLAGLFRGKIIQAITDVHQLKVILNSLAYIGCNIKSNPVKELILSNINVIIQHYIRQEVVHLTGDHIIFDLELIRRFFNINVNYVEGTGRSLLSKSFIRMIVKSSEKMKSNMNFYEKLLMCNKILPKSAIECLQNDPKFTILFLLIKNQKLVGEEWKILIKLYPYWKDDLDFRALFLQIDEIEVDHLKERLISEAEKWGDDAYYLLARMFHKYKNLRMTEENVARIYKDKSLSWLGMVGIQLCKASGTLTLGMLDFFYSGFCSSRSKSERYSYGGCILRDIISTFLENIQEVSVIKFVKFICLTKILLLSLPLATRNDYFSFEQLRSILKLTGDVLNRGILSADSYSKIITSFVVILNSTNMKLINDDTNPNDLLVQDPFTEFQVKISLHYKFYILKLIDFYIHRFGDFSKLCEDISNEIFGISVKSINEKPLRDTLPRRGRADSLPHIPTLLFASSRIMEHKSSEKSSRPDSPPIEKADDDFISEKGSKKVKRVINTPVQRFI